MTSNEVCLLLYLICIGGPSAVLLFGWMWLSYKNQEDRKDIDIALSSNTGTTGIAHHLRLYLSLDDCMDLYNKTFASNGNQVTLQNRHIITKVMKKPITDTVTEIEEDTAQTSTIESSSFVDVELGGTAGNKKNDNDDYVEVDVDDDDNCDVDDIAKTDAIDVDDDSDNDDLDETTTTTTSVRLDHNQERQQQLGINHNGICIICLEEFVTNDVIVWSADPSCSHIYHKQCMVQYLSSNAKNTSKQTRLSSNLIRIPVLDVITNPCPTCRRPKFCSIRDAHIIQHYS